MKKVILMAALAVFTFSSCKKDRTCECKTTFMGATSTVSGTIKETKKKAEEECNKGDQAGITDCEIK